MSITMTHVAYVWASMMFGGLLAIPAILIMHVLMPKAALKKYFKPPHFRPFECHLFTGIPYSPMRTIMFMAVFAWPRLGKKRKMTEAYLLAPKWYRVTSKVFYVVFVGNGILLLILTFVLYIF